jgi:uncharacterized FlaG/YvyC family protein
MGIQGVTGSDLRALSAQNQPRNPQPEEAPVKTEAAGNTQVKRAAVFERVTPAPETAAAKSELVRIPGSDRAGTRFGIDKTTDRIVAQIMSHDREVIKQVPPEELLKVLGKQRRLQGLLFDESI